MNLIDILSKGPQNNIRLIELSCIIQHKWSITVLLLFRDYCLWSFGHFIRLRRNNRRFVSFTRQDNFLCLHLLVLAYSSFLKRRDLENVCSLNKGTHRLFCLSSKDSKSLGQERCLCCRSKPMLCLDLAVSLSILRLQGDSTSWLSSWCNNPPSFLIEL